MICLGKDDRKSGLVVLTLYIRPKEYSYKEIIEVFCYLACRPAKMINLPPILLSLYARMYPEWRRFVYTIDLIKVVRKRYKIYFH